MLQVTPLSLLHQHHMIMGQDTCEAARLRPLSVIYPALVHCSGTSIVYLCSSALLRAATRTPPWPPGALTDVMTSRGDANWEPPVQAFMTWLQRPRVTGAQDASLGLEDFVPISEITRHLRRYGLLRELLSCLLPQEDVREVGSMILSNYTIVFAILVHIGRPRQIVNFLPHDMLCDTKLPFEHRPSQFPLDPFDDDRNSFFGHFQAVQPRFCPKNLIRGTLNVRDEQRMPFLEKSFIGRGASAKVYKIKVHADYDHMKKEDGSV